MTAKEVQEEFINMDIRKLRSFLNQYCSYKKIGKNYYVRVRCVKKKNGVIYYGKWSKVKKVSM